MSKEIGDGNDTSDDGNSATSWRDSRDFRRTGNAGRGPRAPRCGVMVLSDWSGRVGSREGGGERGAQRGRAAPRLPQVPTEAGPHALRLFEGLSVDDPYQIAVGADVTPSANLASYAVVVGDGLAQFGIVSGTRLTRTSALLAGLCHGLDQFSDQTSMRVLLDDPELVPVLTDALRRPGGLSRRQPRRLRQMSLNGQITADRIRSHLRRLPAATISPPSTARPDGLVPADPLLGQAFRLAWHTLRLAQSRRIGLRHALDWLPTAAVLDNTVEKMSHRLAQLLPALDPGNGAAR